MKKLKKFQHQKEFDTKTLFTPAEGLGTQQADAGEKTKVYEPRPLTPDDDIYEDILEQFASAPTKPKYWFEEFGDYWSCSCGHINKGTHCKSCGLEREVLRSLFILHKPADAPGKLNKKLKGAKDRVDQEEFFHAERERQKQQAGDDIDDIRPIAHFLDPDAVEKADLEEAATESAAAAAMEAAPEEEPSSEEPVMPDEPEETALPDTEKPLLLTVDGGEKKPKKVTRKRILIAAIVLVFLLVAGASAAAYVYLAAPAMQYEDALQLKADGKYERAINKFESLGDYRDSADQIWECYIAIGDQQYDAGEYQAAIETYNIAMELKESNKIDKRIRKCHIAIGDQYLANGEYENALASYATAMEFRETDALREKINQAKFAYVEANLSKRGEQVEAYMAELMALKYPGIQALYDTYYAWHVKLVVNTAADDYSTDLKSASRNDIVYFHVTLSGGEPSEQIELYYEITWPNGSSQVSDLGSTWKAGSQVTARFQYPIPLFGKEGTLTFQLFDKGTNQSMGSKSITLQN